MGNLVNKYTSLNFTITRFLLIVSLYTIVFVSLYLNKFAIVFASLLLPATIMISLSQTSFLKDKLNESGKKFFLGAIWLSAAAAICCLYFVIAYYTKVDRAVFVVLKVLLGFMIFVNFTLAMMNLNSALLKMKSFIFKED